MKFKANRCFLVFWCRLVVMLFSASVGMSIGSQGQTYPTGQLLVGNGSTTIQSSQIVLDATQFSTAVNTQCANKPPLSSDMCGQVQAAICAAPSANGITIDARGFTGTQSCGSNPLASPNFATVKGDKLTTTPVTLLLPPQTINTSATWYLPAFAKLIGQNQTVTTIHWSGAGMQPSGNCTAGVNCTPVICMGSPTLIPNTMSGTLYCDTPNSFTNTPRTQISGLRIDCDSASTNTHTVGLVDITAQEQSWFQNGGAENCAGAGIYVGPTGTLSPAANQVQNSGPFTNLEINYGNSSTTSTLGMYVQGGPSITVGIGGHITFNQVQGWVGGNRPNTALSVNGFQVSVADIHCEHWTNDCVLIGPVSNSLSTWVHNITITSTVGNAVHISSNHVTGVVSSAGCQDLGTNCNSSNVIQDEQSSFTTPSGTYFESQYVIAKSGDPDNFVAHGNSVIDGVSNYNNVPTVRSGIASEVASVDSASLHGPVPPTTLYMVPAVGSGRRLYRVSWSAVVTRAASGSSTLGGTTGFQLVYTDNDTGGTVTTPQPGAPAAGSNTAYSQTNQSNTVGTTQISGVIVVNCQASTNLQYQMGYTNGGTLLMNYALHITVEAL